MKWTAEQLDRLYELYQQHIERLRADVIKSNRSLGSRNPEKTALKCSSREEFAARVTRETDDPEVVQLWIRRIIRGHEHEFPALAAVTRLRVTPDDAQGKRPRRTGT
jgi:hypothetical protein